MSRKSGFSNRLSLERPGVTREVPHHREPLGCSRSVEIRVAVTCEPTDADGDVPSLHELKIPRDDDLAKDRGSRHQRRWGAHERGDPSPARPV
jgi:hypothetical protein